VKKATIDYITMTECCMIRMGFGRVWEHDNHVSFEMVEKLRRGVGVELAS